MSNYNIRQMPKTVSTLIVSGLIASTYTHAPIIQKEDSGLQFVSSYSTNAISKTTSSQRTDIFHSMQQKEFQFENVLTNFVTQLSSQQEDLGEGFQNVLMDNLWDLYQT